ncbi:unnamed protein product [Porites lobata]|uniref:Uncharacterized protein n=1 Tax=Porites lobata TaxID=104759 RepID=A0ABN8NAD9_9CNID|nr:unnamed protein product [Porites lobata]
MRCFRKLLGISYRDHITNDAVRNDKLKWFGHVSRSAWLAKTILQGTVHGGRRRDRQKLSVSPTLNKDYVMLCKWWDRKAEIHLEEGRLRNGVAIVLEQKHLYWYLD